MTSSRMVSAFLLFMIFLSSCEEEVPVTDTANEQLVEGESSPFDSIGIEMGNSAASPGLTVCTLSVHRDREPFEISLYWVGPPDAAPGFRQAHTLTTKPLNEGGVTVFDGLESNYYESSELRGYLITEDMNFDGYTDFRLIESLSAGPNTYWYFWLFDPDRGTFDRSMEYEDNNLVSPEFDQDNRTIICFHRDGMGIYGTEHYFIENGHLLIVRDEQTELQVQDSLVTTVTELVNDEMIVTEQTVQEID